MSSKKPSSARNKTHSTTMHAHALVFTRGSSSPRVLFDSFDSLSGLGVALCAASSLGAAPMSRAPPVAKRPKHDTESITPHTSSPTIGPHRTPEERATHIEMLKSRRAVAQLPRYVAFLEYDGTHTHGFQRQANAALNTVQGAVDKALAAFTGGRLDVQCTGSSRTDVGVHALRNAVHFDIARTRDDSDVVEPYGLDNIHHGLNYHLRKLNVPVRVVECVRVDELNPAFHARHDATARTYAYEIIVGKNKHESLFDRDRAWYLTNDGQGRATASVAAAVATTKNAEAERARRLKAGFGSCDGALNVDAMRRAARVLVGTHDFSSFRANGCQASSPVRTVTRIEVRETPTYWPAPYARGATQKVSIDVAAPSFLYHQVRLLVGALKAVGAGDINVDDVREILDAKDVSRCPQMAPACGLYLADVEYLDGFAVRPSYAKLDGETLKGDEDSTT